MSDEHRWVTNEALQREIKYVRQEQKQEAELIRAEQKQEHIKTRALVVIFSLPNIARTLPALLGAYEGVVQLWRWF